MTKKVGSPSPTQMRLYNSYTLQMIQYPVRFVEYFNKNRVATKVRTYFEMRTDGQRFFV